MHGSEVKEKHGHNGGEQHQLAHGRSCSLNIMEETGKELSITITQRLIFTTCLLAKR
jgi:hypothetical protein